MNGAATEACEKLELAREFLAGKLDGVESAAYRAHLIECASCRALVDSGEARDTAPAPQLGGSVLLTRPSQLLVEAPLGEGGMGTVYRASDRELERDVALKLMKSSPAPAPSRSQTRSYAPEWQHGDAEARFLREAYITARLQHPSIVPVYQTGRLPSGEPFYTMKLVSGQSLKDLVADKPALTDRLQLLPSVLAAADAIAYAHSRRVIHRDLKPGNIMVGPFGETLVIDWGLAKDLSASHDGDDAVDAPVGAPETTQAGAVLGTPAFMAPEQARGELVDERADVYALGGVLHHVLARTPPGPQRPRLPTGTPRELQAIVDRAMALAPSERYPNAAELAEDLRRFLAGQLVRAHEYSRATLFLRWMRRHRAPLSVAALALVALTATGVVSFRRVARERNHAEAERAAAVAKRNQLILLEARSLLSTDPTRSLAWLKTYPSDGSDWDEVQAIAAEAQSAGVARHTFPEDQVIASASFPDGKRLAIAGRHRHVTVYDVDSGRQTAQLPLESEVALLAIAPDGKRLAFATADAQLGEWDLAGKPEMLTRGKSGPFGLTYSPDGRYLARNDFDGLTLFDRRAQTSRHFDRTVSYWFSGSSRLLLRGDPTGAIHVIELDSGAERVVRTGPAWANYYSFSGDGKLVAVARGDGTVRVLELPSLKERIIGRHDGWCSYVHFVGATHLVFSYGKDRLLSTWDADRGTAVSRWPGPSEAVQGVATSDDGELVGTADLDGNVQLFDRATGEGRRLEQGGATSFSFVFSPRRDWMLTAGRNPPARLWLLRAPARRRFADPDEQVAPFAAFSPDGKSFATDAGAGVRLCSVDGGTCRITGGRDGLPLGVAFSPDGKQVLSGAYDGLVRLTDVASGEVRVIARPCPIIERAIWSSDGKLVVYSGNDGIVRLLRVGETTPKELRGHTGPIHDLAFSPDEKSLASAGDDHTVRVWDLATGQGRVFTGLNSEAYEVAFSPDGKKLAGGAWDGLRVWDLASGVGVDLAGRESRISAVVMPSPERVIAASLDGNIYDFDLLTRNRRVLSGHQGPVRRLALSPDRRVIASASDDKTARLWDLSTGAEQVLRGHHGPLQALVFSPDGKRLLSTSADRSAIVWTLDEPPSVPRGQVALRRWLEETTSATVGER